jgi:hypothetical protein
MRMLRSPLQLFLLGLLIFGILAKPVLAIACEIHDATRAVAAVSQDAAEAAPASGQDESCCDLPDCNDCCAHTVALMPTLAALRAEPAAAAPLPALSVTFEPAALAVAFRPPILV